MLFPPKTANSLQKMPFHKKQQMLYQNFPKNKFIAKIWFSKNRKIGANKYGFEKQANSLQTANSLQKCGFPKNSKIIAKTCFQKKNSKSIATNMLSPKNSKFNATNMVFPKVAKSLQTNIVSKKPANSLRKIWFSQKTRKFYVSGFPPKRRFIAKRLVFPENGKFIANRYGFPKNQQIHCKNYCFPK